MPIGILGNTTQTSLLNNLNRVNNSISSNLNKLSSGLRITKASDDAAGLAVATRLQSDIGAFSQALGNIQSGASLLSTAEGAINQISGMLSRAKELAVQSSNGTLSNEARQAISAEYNSIKEEITRVAETTEFNGQKLLSGDFTPASAKQVEVQAGISNSSSDRISLNVIEGVTSAQLGIQNSDISTQANARSSINDINNAISQINSRQAGIGATVNRLSNASSNLGISIENLTSAVSSIKDLDYASEISGLNKNNIIQTASIKTIAQANNSRSDLIGRLLNTKG